MGVVHCHETLWLDNFGFADVKVKSRPTSNTIYGIGSMTKGIVAAAVANLVATGKLSSFDEQVKNVMPKSFSHQNEQVKNDLTVRDLLSHRSGLSGFNSMSMAFQGDGEMLLEKDQLFKVFAGLPQDAPLRSSWVYLLWGYSMVGAIIAEVSGQTLDEYLKTSVLKPLGMGSTSVRPSELEKTGNLAKAYGALSNAEPFELPHRQLYEETFFEASGGLYSNIEDMLKWSKEVLGQLDETIPRNEPRGQLASLVETTSSQIPVDNPNLRESSYGMGWIRAQLPNVVGLVGDARDIWESRDDNPIFSVGPGSKIMIYHQGASVGYYSCMLLFPETGSAVVVLTNTAALGDAADWVARAVAEALFLEPSPTDYQALAQRYKDDHLQKYADMQSQITAERDNSTKPGDLSPYKGRYHHERLQYFIDIDLASPEHGSDLVLRFQGHELQTYQLRHHHHEVFEWSLLRDEAVKRGRYHWWDPAFFQMRFEAMNSGKFMKLVWTIDSDPQVGKEEFVREASHQPGFFGRLLQFRHARSPKR